MFLEDAHVVDVVVVDQVAWRFGPGFHDDLAVLAVVMPWAGAGYIA